MFLYKQTLVLYGRPEGGTVHTELLLSPQRMSTAFSHSGLHTPRASAATATKSIQNTIYRLELVSPDSPKFILGDFKSLKGFNQCITCSTRLRKTMEKCYGSVPDAFKSVHSPSSALLTTTPFCLPQHTFRS